MHSYNHLIVFARFPTPGKSKTRLIPTLGEEEAAELQRQMTEYTIRQARKTGVPIEVRTTGGTEEQLRERLGDDLQYTEQGDGDLGERIARAFQDHFDAGAERVVIIGSDCPSNHWKNILKSFQTLEKVNEGFDVECIIADGGSTDQTQVIARQSVSHFMKCDRGRGRQMNAGAAAASGEILLFLHADTELPNNWDFLIRSALKNPQVALGAFLFQVKERLRGIGWVEWGTNIRSKFFRMPYGDQGLFLRREMFEKIGGFAEQPILEDVKLVKAARKFGKIITLDEPAMTSGRRWQQLGVLRTTVRNQLILLGAALGVPPQRLRMVYMRKDQN